MKSKEVFGQCMYFIWLVFVRVVGNHWYVSCKYIHWRIFEQIGIGKAYLHAFWMTIREIDTTKELWNLFRNLLTNMLRAPPKITAMVLNTPWRYRESIWYYNKDKNKAHPSSGVQAKH